MMEARNLSRRFGGLLAVSNLSLTLRPGELHAVIGPNGAGKSTLVNLLAGELFPSEGSIIFKGTDITGFNTAKRGRAGIGRTFQRTSLMPEMTVLENVRLAAQVHERRLLRRATAVTTPIAVAEQALRRVGLGDFAGSRALTLSHGQMRQLEIAVALAGQPSVLLLDEPLAGSGAEDAEPLIALMKDLSLEHAVLLIEHDMDVVFAVADIITVMVDGRMLARGTAHEIAHSVIVRDAYLGHEVA